MVNKEVFMNLKIDRGKSLRESIAESIEELIAREELKTGRLPSERELAKTFGVNQATVSDAITLLEERGLVMRKHGRGTFIKNVTGNVLLESIERYYVFKDCSFEELVAIRSILEPGVAALAAKKASEEDIAKLDELSQKLILYRDQVTLAAGYDTEFHETLARATQNKLIEVFMSGIQRILKRFIYQEMVTINQPKDMIANVQHRFIYEAVAAHDPERASRVMAEHIGMLTRAIENGRAQEISAVDPKPITSGEEH